jgi:hypothetical protein
MDLLLSMQLTDTKEDIAIGQWDTNEKVLTADVGGWSGNSELRNRQTSAIYDFRHCSKFFYGGPQNKNLVNAPLQ